MMSTDYGLEYRPESSADKVAYVSVSGPAYHMYTLKKEISSTETVYGPVLHSAWFDDEKGWVFIDDNRSMEWYRFSKN